MKKEKVVFIIGIAAMVFSSIISVSAVSYIYNSNEVSYDNNKSKITSTDVQGAIDELYEAANDYSSINTRLTNLENNFLDKTYPVGSIYISVEDDTVAKVQNKFGGTWEVFGSGRTLVGVDTSDSNFNTVAKEVGSNSQSYTPAGTNTGTAITTEQMPSHTHTFTGSSATTSSTSKTLTGWVVFTNNVALNGQYNLLDRGGIISGETKNQPQVTINSGTYTAPTYSHTKGFSIDATHTHNLTAKGSNSNTGGGKTHTHTFTGTAATISHIQKSITVYMYKRVS